MTADAADVVAALPDYQIGELLGRGQFGVVWAARHRRLGRPAAVKQLTGRAVADPRDAARFRREARLLAHLDHRHVVRVFDFRETDGLSLLIMERLTGGTLADRQAAGLDARSILVAIVAAASGLHHLHRQGVLHRDVKPANLMFDGAGVLKVTDFGTARGQVLLGGAGEPADIPEGKTIEAITAEVEVGATFAGAFVGTPGYAAPEQAAVALGLAAEPVGPAADQYALATVLYRALTGCYPHAVDGGVVPLLVRRASQPARPVLEANPAVPPALTVPIERALARRPDDRYPSVEAFALALCAAAESVWGSGWATGAVVDVAEPGPLWNAVHPPPPPPPPGAAGSRPRPRRRWPVPVAAAALLLVAGTGAAWMLTRPPDSTAGPGSAAGSSAASTATSTPTSSRTLVADWRFPTGGQVFATPAVAGDVVVVGSKDGAIYGVGRDDHQQRWRVPTGDAVRSSAAIDGDLAVVGSDDGQVRGISVTTGAVVWSIRVGYTVASGPALTADSVYVSADKLYAYDRATQTERWSKDLGANSSSTPAVAGDLVIVGSNDGQVYAFRTTDGEPVWQVPMGGPVLAGPVVDGDVVVVGSRSGRVVALDVGSGDVVWQRDAGSAVHGAAAVGTDLVVVGTVAGSVLALDRSDGEPVWDWPHAGRIDSGPALHEGIVYVGTQGGRLIALDAAAGQEIAAFTTGGPALWSPRAVGDSIYVGSDDGSLFRILTG